MSYDRRYAEAFRQLGIEVEPPETNDWEVIAPAEHNGGRTRRLRIEGGWLYRFTPYGEGDTAMVFVPEARP